MWSVVLSPAREYMGAQRGPQVKQHSENSHRRAGKGCNALSKSAFPKHRGRRGIGLSSPEPL